MENNVALEDANVNAELPKRLSFSSYLVSVLSFIPVLGLLLGFMTFIYGLCRWKQKGWILSMISVVGMACGTFAFYGSFYYVMMLLDKGPFVEASKKVVDSSLLNSIQKIEQWKIVNGRYPNRLQEAFKPVESAVNVVSNKEIANPQPQFEQLLRMMSFVDQLATRRISHQIFFGSEPKFKRATDSAFPLFQYKYNKECNQYYLFSVGVDGIPFTDDDILPDINLSASDKLGYSHRHPEYVEQVKCRIKKSIDSKM